MKTLFASMAEFSAGPVNAITSAQIPEPSNMALMGLGLAGLVIGRSIAKNKRRGGD